METLTSKQTETKWGGWLETIALSYKMTNGEQRENGNCCGREGDRSYYENYVSRGKMLMEDNRLPPELVSVFPVLNAANTR